MFITEVLELTTNGITINNKITKVTLEIMCCDVPAKNFLLQVKGHSDFFSCTRKWAAKNYGWPCSLTSTPLKISQEEVTISLSELESQLTKNLKRIVIRRKRSRGVPILFTTAL